MRKLADHPPTARNGHRTGLRKLQVQRRQLSARLARLDRAIQTLHSKATAKKASSGAGLSRWLDALEEGLPDLPALPADFSRADLYDDHD